MLLRETQPFVNGIYDVQDVNIDLDPLRKRISELELDESLWWSRNDGKQTHNLIDITHPEYVELFSRIDYYVDNIAKHWGLGGLKLKCYFTNIDRQYGFSQSHSHIASVLSGVFYVTVPDKSGDIVFDRPDCQEYQYKISNSDSPYTRMNYHIKPKENMALFFPSHMKHSVSVHKFGPDENRISIAFDYSL